MSRGRASIELAVPPFANHPPTYASRSPTIMIRSHRSLFLLTSILASITPCAFASAGDIDFQKQIQPILAEHCSQCHGVDQAAREGGLRVDTREGILTGGDSGNPAVVPGKSSESELVRRILSSDPDTVMPPPQHDNPLSPDETELLRQWIDGGAEYELHWAFESPNPIKLKTWLGIDATGMGSEIDQWVRKTHRSHGWTPNPVAEPWELCRRVYLDLIGVPPTPEQVAAFERDGLDSTIDRLLKDARYGERWARSWLDVARYSDTNGYEKDLQREQWAWRDWVIDAFNRDMPYDQFVIEQLAGDLLPDATQDQIVATGFLRNSMINEEGAIVPEQFRMVEMFDRMDCLGKAVLGMSLQCAQCHTHKFDPITHDEYYGMFAFFNNTYEARSWVYTAEQLETLREIRSGIRGEISKFQNANSDWASQYAAWREQTLQSRADWNPLQAELLETISGLNHPVQEEDGSILMVGHTSNDVFMIAPAPIDRITGLQFEVLTHGELPFRGPGRSGVGMWDLRELELLIQRPGSKEWEKQKLASATADFSNADEKAADGKHASGPVAYLIDGSDDTTWKSDRGLGRRNQSSVAVVQLETPLENLKDCKLKVVWRQGDMVGSCRISVTGSTNPIAPAIDHDAILAMVDPAGPEPSEPTLLAWMGTRDDAKATRDAIQSQWQRFPNAKTSILHLTERSQPKQRTTFVLSRGNWDQPQRPIQPKMISSMHEVPVSEQPARLRLARWLVDRQSPLAARVAVNRVWQNLFGQGLVETSEDFGIRAPVPEYQGILDRLALDFMEGGWSQKALIRSIMKSDAYQRSSRTSAPLMDVDPKNRWLTRGPRYRYDAETVRDIVLSVSGLLHEQQGGPSVIPPVPQNVLDYNYTYPSYWTPAQGPDRYRRAMYMFRKRSMPDPVLSAFDAPNGDLACARRARSNTPLAALTALNEPIFVEAAGAFAIRILKESPPSDEQRIERAFLLALSRKPNDRERTALLRFAQSQRQRLAEGWLNPREILTGDPAKLKDLPEGSTPQDAAAWTLVARVVLNLDEVLNKQ